LPHYLAPGEKLSVSVWLTPSLTGEFLGKLHFHMDGGMLDANGNPAPGWWRLESASTPDAGDIPLSGVGVSPDWSISPLSMDFLEQPITASPGLANLLILNTSQDPLARATPHLLGADASSFKLKPIDSSDEYTSVDLSFAPTAPGSNTASLEVRNADTGGLLASVPLRGLALADTDADGIADRRDNCQQVANPDQRDSDHDGYGNLCDGDLNNDGKTDGADLKVFNLRYKTSDADADFNGDGIVNTLDLSILKLLYGKPPGPSGLVSP
jgi:hypothetical protein